MVKRVRRYSENLKHKLKKVRRQGVSYTQKFRGKRGFPDLANGTTSQFMFRKYLIGYQNVKIVKSKFKGEKSRKRNIKAM